MLNRMRQLLAEHQEVANRMGGLLPAAAQVAAVICQILDDGGRVYVCGNGGSAADAQHFAAELVGRFRRERRPLAAVALTTDTSALTCIGNDYSFTEIFARQVEALVTAKDLVLGITTSGNSPNILRALEEAARRGAVTVALTGGDGGRAAQAAAYTLLVVPATTTARIQEMHILLIHMICECIDDWVLGGGEGRS